MDINSVIASELNKNAAVNTFSRGMNTDAADNLMPSDQYRLAKNLRLVANEGGNGELRLIEGARNIMTPFEDDIIATTQIRDFGIVITGRRTLDDNNKPYITDWSIWRFNINHPNDPQQTLKIFGECNEKMGPAFSLVTRYEDDDNIKLYIADGKHPLMYINISPEIDANRTQDGDLNRLLSITQHTFGGFTSVTEITGRLKPAAVQYSYVLYNKYGNASNISPLSQLKLVYNRNSTITRGAESAETSNVGYNIQINESATPSYSKIRIYRITYNLVGQDPEVAIIADEDLSSGTFEFNDVGTDILTVSYSEFLALIRTSFTPTEIESKGDYLFASNVKYQIDVTKDIIEAFSNLDMSCQITSASYTDMTSEFSSSWSNNSGTYSEFLLQRVTTGIKSLRRDEIYRYGVVFYDKYENAWPVKFLCDLRTPPILSSDSDGNGSLKNLIVGFTIKWDDIIDDYECLEDFFKGFEIVRCNRTSDDRYTISQGIVGRVFDCYEYKDERSFELDLYGEPNPENRPTSIICPTGFMTTDGIVAYHSAANPDTSSASPATGSYTFGISSQNTMLFASPEVCYQYDDVMNILDDQKNNIKIECIWQGLGLLKSGTRAISGSGNIVNVKYRVLEDGSIPGLTFLSNRLNHGNGFIQDDSTSNTLWVGIRYTPYIHEPLGYHMGDDDGEQKEATDDTYTTFAASGTATADNYYRNPGGVEMRNTIFNYFDIPFNPVNSYSASSDVSFLTGHDDQNDVKGVALRNRGMSVSDVSKVNVPTFDQISSGDTPTFKNDYSTIGGKLFIPWSVPTATTATSMSRISVKNSGIDNWDVDAGIDTDGVCLFYPMSAVGKSILIKTNGSWFTDSNIESLNYRVNTTRNLTLSVCNLRKIVCTPYGGFSKNARENSTYYSFGNYSSLSNSAVTMAVQDGDCFIQKFRYNAAKTFYTPETRYGVNMTTIYVVPVESDINVDFETGWTSRDKDEEQNKYIQDKAAVLRGYTQDKPCYISNTALNTNKTARYFVGQDVDSLLNINYDCRVCYSNQKSNNEFIDSWLTFKSANYIDVDSRYGQITNLRLFKDTLLFWQEQAAGVLSVNERTMLQDANDTNIILGNGSVLQRYDYLTTQYGMKPNQFVDGQSNTTLYWWDEYKKEILSYSGGQSVTPMNKIKTVDKYLKDGWETTNPVIVHDTKHNEMLFNVVNDASLVYSEYAQQFTSQYDVNIKHKLYFNETLVIVAPVKSNDPRIEKDALREWNCKDVDELKPYLKFVVNPNGLYNNTFDIMQIGGDLYKKDIYGTLNDINATFVTSLKQKAILEPNSITDREYDYRLTIPRAGRYVGNPPHKRWITGEWGDRLRGKTMECELASNSDDLDFSLQYIITKYRKSWI